MPAQSSFDYALVRVVPRVEREEFLNVGVILFCRSQGFLAVRVEPDLERLLALAPFVDVEMVQAEMDWIRCICAGGEGSGPIGELGQAERFHWLVSPRSTTVQISPVHCGLCGDPQQALDELWARLVA